MRPALVLALIAGCYNPSAIPGDPDGDPADGPSNGCTGDDFNNALDMRWQVLMEMGGVVASSYQELALALPAPATSNKVSLTTSEAFDFTGGEIRIEIVQPPSFDTVTLAFRLEIGAVAYDIRYAGDALAVRAASNPEVPAGAFHPVLTRHWRIRHDAGLIRFETSADRVTWDPLDGTEAVPAGPLTEARASVELSGTTAGTAAATAALDNFELVTASCPPRSVSRVVLDTFGTAIAPLESHVGEVGGTWARIRGTTSTARIGQGRVAHDDNAEELIYTASGLPPDADYDVEAELITLSNLQATIGITARTVAANNNSGYLFAIDHGVNNTFAPRLTRAVNGVFTNLSCQALSFATSTGQRYRLRLRVRGAEITGSVDGREVCRATDDQVAAPGLAGLTFVGPAATTTGLHLDHFLVTSAAQ